MITPLILAFSNSAVLGIIQTISAIGMLVTSFIIGVRTIKIAYLKMLTGSLFFAGIYMALFGLRENIILICISGFLFLRCDLLQIQVWIIVSGLILKIQFKVECGD